MLGGFKELFVKHQTEPGFQGDLSPHHLLDRFLKEALERQQ